MFIVDRHFLLDQLVSAGYSSDPFSFETNQTVLCIVQSYIEDGRLLPVLNDQFRGDPDPGETKFLVLRFRNDLTINVRERLVVDFSIIEKIVRIENGMYFGSKMVSLFVFLLNT